MSFKSLLLMVFVFFLMRQQKAATCVAILTADWNNGTTWSCGAKPGCGDSIVIPSGFTVTISTQQDYIAACGLNGSPLKIAIYGELQFVAGNKLKLPCNSRIYVFPGGKIDPGNGAGNSNTIEICDNIVWAAGDGTYSGPGCFPATLPSCAAVLPIELLNFTAKINTEKIDLSWATAIEQNSARFEVERSNNASDFEKAVSVQSKAPDGNSQYQIDYTTSDSDPLDGVSYYRLKQVDKDDTYSYSSMVSVEFIKAKNIRFLIYPNPNSGEFTADISGLENNHEVRILLRDEKGNIIYRSSFYIGDTSAKLQIVPSSKLASGVYICSLILEEVEYKVKVVVSGS